ncbi:amino acid adenylation domain-containing protein [Actinophytocola glycyrrhizae]|uniref:Amino acid adenylation domain-containing protein n=1 Tax=Actinophytocola glycyrrhizae TaxID=2044873 RepID=A0ABV9RUE5_9PSEU
MTPGLGVHRLIEAQVSATPDAVAVVWDGGTLTFRELDVRANRLAHLFVAGGVRPERLVGVAMEPSADLLVAMLAVWKAGGVYVPIDQSLPGAAAEAMIADAGITYLVRNGPVTVDPAGVPVVDLARVDLADRPDTVPAVAVAPANLAYCIFTSGSTGKPKPVAVAHASFTNHAVSLRDQLKLRPADRVLQSTAIAFDAALEEILPAWLGGAAVVMPDRPRFTSLEFTELIDRLGVTMVSLPSAYWHQWVDDLTAGLVCLPDSLRIVFIGGDKILVEKLAAWYRLPGAERIDWVSDYGPTETTISVALHRPSVKVADPDLADYALVPIGRPFAGAVFYILDGDLRPVSDGLPGDIWIGGPVLSRGYHASPAVTADRFRPDPYGLPGARMYRTGDRGSRLTDGTLVFLGRSDRQVKIRGHRVEPGQVESAIHHCAGVKDAVVVAVEDPPFGSRLVAYVEAEHVSEEAIRTELAGRLPEAMVPQAIVLLNRIPRSPLNGKVARAQLPPVAATRSERADTAGMTALERVLVSLVGDVLDGGPIRRDEDFFAAGGDSLRALQLLSRVAEVTGVALTFAQLRAAPSVVGLAALVKREHGRGALDGTVLPAGARGNRRPASRSQKALWFLDQVHRSAPIYAIPVCYRVLGALDLHRVDAALTAIVARHEALRTVFEAQDGEIWQRIQSAGPVHTTVTDVASIEEAACLAAEQAARPFDLGTGAMLRSACFRVGDRKFLWLLNVHHAVFDAWSLAVFWREFGRLYGGHSLPEPAVQYGDYQAWQERWLLSAEADEQRAYWRGRLAGDLPLLEIGSRDGVEGRIRTAGFAVELPSGSLNPSAVERVARACGSTAATVLLAAFSATLHRVGGTDDLVVGVPVACRNRPGTEDLIGYLVNTVALRLRFTEGMRFSELVARVGEALSEALSHQELPFVDVVEGMSRTGLRSAPAGANPLFDAMFALQSTPLDGCAIEGLDIAEHFVHSGTAKVALTWSVRQAPTGLAGEVEYAADRFDEASASRWQEALLALLAAATADPGAMVDELPLSFTEQVTSGGL